ncbi:MAG: TonB-dependent receptor, partial [Exilibacterium sp.]
MNITRAIVPAPLKTLKLILAVQLAVAAPAALAIEELDVEGGCPKDKAVKVDIPAQTMENSLSALAQQSGFQVVFYSKDARNVSAKSIAGEFENCFAAINALLEGTGLGYYIIDKQTISIRPVESSDRLGGRDGILLAANGDMAIGSQRDGGNLSEPEAYYINSFEIEEIVVTANKRKQNLQDTAMSISALSNEEIERRSLLNMDDYLNSIPGVSAQVYAPGANKIVMRGVGAGLFEDATVAMYFGEVPVNVTSPISAVTGSVTDLKLVDIERVEVLRGPQGTLYGSGSMGGTVRNIPAAPKLQEFEGKLSPGYSNTAGYGEGNTKLSGMINIPIIDNELALRVVAYNYKNSGYIKNVSSSNTISSSLAEASGAKVNQDDEFGDLEYNGIRASLLWSKGDLDISLMALSQELEQEGLLRGNLALDAYEANPLSIDLLEKRGEFAGDDTEIYNLVIEYDFGLVSLLSSSSWQDGQTQRGFDLSRSFPLAGAIADNWRREGFTQEIRLNSQWDSPFQIIGGFYYEDIKSSRTAKAEWIGDDDLCCGFLGAADPRNLFTLDDEVVLNQKAIFSELSYKFTDQLMMTYGARWFDYERDDSMARNGAFNGGMFTYRELNSDEDNSSLMANLTYAPDEDSLLYLQWSQGFRLGKPVPPPPPA